MVKKLWNRVLSCGHSRSTDVSYILGDGGKKPEVGAKCYCRICFEEANIIEVQEIE